MDYVQMAIALVGEEKAKNMSNTQLRMLGQQLAELQGIKLPDLPEVKAEQMDPSAVGGMQGDEALRGKQLQALAEIQNMIDQGGLDMTDKLSLEEAMGAAGNQQHRARAGVAGDMSQRGQLNSGARLMMDLDAAQAGANTAHRTGMETAAMAQQKRMAAIKDASAMSGGLREQDWREHETANRAKDLRDERNAAAREKAGYYNAGLPQQNFNNQITKTTGQQTGVNAMAQGLSAAAQDARASAAGMAGAVGAYGGVHKNGGTDTGAPTYTYNQDTANRDQNGERGGYTDLTRDENDK